MCGKTKWAGWRTLCALAFVLLFLPVSLVGQTTWEEKNRAGEKLFQEGKLADANRLFLESLQEAQKFGSNDLRLAPIYNNLALVAFVRSNFVTSEGLYEKAIAVVESSRGADDPLLVPILENLTRLYVKEWAFTKAMGTGRRICAIREKTLGPENPDTISSLNQLATLYLDSVRLLPRSDQSPSIATNAKGEAASPASPTGSGKDEPAPDDAAKLATAESLYRRVLVSQEKTFGPRNNRLVDVLQNLGEVLHAEGKPDQAGESYARSAGIIEESFGKEDQKLAGPLQHMADLNAEQDRYPEAAELYGRALQIREKTSGESDPALFPLLTGYAAVMEKMQKPEEAKRLSDRAKALAMSRKPEALRAVNQTLFVPYLMRFERVVYDRYAGVHQTCVLVRGDGRVRLEDQQREGHGPVNNQIQRSPDGMGDMPAAQETLDMSGANPQPVRIFESIVDNNSLQQLTAILSAKDIRNIHGNYPASGSANYYGTEKVAVSVLRDESVQNFAFPDLQARQPYEDGLKPLLKWLSNAEKHKGDALKQAIPNNCSPDPPSTVPTQFGPSRPVFAAHSSTNSKPDAASHPAPVEPGSSDGTIKVAVNLVLVRVVVRDAQGHVVRNLRQKDFQLFDNRKPRPITRFTVEQSANPAIEAPDKNVSDGAKPQSSVATPTERSLAYFLDDVQLNAGNLAELQSAADRQISSLPPSVQAALFTTSGQTTLDFTADHAKLREALSRIKPRKTAGSEGNNCPDIDTYMADLIWNKHDEDALDAATEDALVCAYGNDVRFAGAAEAMARATAQQRSLAAENDGRNLLVALQSALRKLAAAPGQRSLILVSPGFISPGGEQDYARLIEGALHTDVTISALDARGLYVIDSVGSRTRGTVDYQRDGASAASELMTTMAESTGGTVFHNNNDFNMGFNRVAQTPESSYVLGFSPTEQELDGKFHTLGVTVDSQDEKLTVQARKGYYAIARGK